MAHRFRLLDRDGSGPRLEADIVLTPDDFDAIARQLGRGIARARKTGYIAARQAKWTERVNTYWNGKETTNTAREGDWVVTSLSEAGEPLLDSQGLANQYVVAAHRFPDLYESAPALFGTLYRAKGVVLVIPLQGGFKLLGPWGEYQEASSGYLLCNGVEVYGNNAGTFAATYEALPD